MEMNQFAIIYYIYDSIQNTWKTDYISDPLHISNSIEKAGDIVLKNTNNVRITSAYTKLKNDGNEYVFPIVAGSPLGNRCFKLIDISALYDQESCILHFSIGMNNGLFVITAHNQYYDFTYKITAIVDSDAIDFYRYNGCIYIVFTKGDSEKLYIQEFSQSINSNLEQISEEQMNAIVQDGSKLNVSGLYGFGDDRAVYNKYVGLQYFDTILNKPIYWNGTSWIDPTENISWAVIE